jgi:co-chaperonin GroES (HSP10)|tara:strand:+ start:1633 stop:1890 length:258 start_codon:yes stop_codon:yes gene_type:complete
MRAINEYLVVDNINTGVKKVGGLIMPEKIDTDNRYVKATVVSFGNLVQHIKEGDVIYYDKHNGNGIDFNDKIYQVIKARDIVLVE